MLRISATMHKIGKNLENGVQDHKSDFGGVYVDEGPIRRRGAKRPREQKREYPTNLHEIPLAGSTFLCFPRQAGIPPGNTDSGGRDTEGEAQRPCEAVRWFWCLPAVACGVHGVSG